MEVEKKAWSWVSSLYFIEGLPNAVIMGLAVQFYVTMGLRPAYATALTASLGLPWILKPLWSPLIDAVSSKRAWIFRMLAVFVLCFAVLAISPFFSAWVIISLVGFWLLGFASATYDISADGFYMLALSEKSQAFFVGIRNTFYRFANIFAKGGLVGLAGIFAARGEQATGWAAAFLLCAIICAVSIFLFKFTLPKASADAERGRKNLPELVTEFMRSFKTFFDRPFILPILLYILLYRFSEAQLGLMLPIFLMADPADGGLGLTLTQNAFVNGTVGVAALLSGGIIGGVLISKFGLQRCLIPMACAINIPTLVYVLLAYVQISSIPIVSLCVGVEQFGYGLGFASFMMFLIYTSRGDLKTSHYAIATGIMALGLHLPASFSGAVQESIGFVNFFWWLMLCSVVSFAVTIYAKYAIKKGL